MFIMRYPNDGSSEKQYLNLVDYLANGGGDYRMERTGTGSYSEQGVQMRFDLRDGSVPLLTTKKMDWENIQNELHWFLDGNTNIKWLVDRRVHIWSEWPHKKYVEATGDNITVKEFNNKIRESNEFAEKWGDLGPVYGKQWRRWQGPDGKEYDQVQSVIDILKSDKSSRRALFHGWNVSELEQMALPPCHLLYQFYVKQGKYLGLTLYQRSCDVGLGVPYNIVSASFLVHMMAQQLGLEPGELVWFGHDVHLYANHVDKLVQEQLPREPRPFPKLKILRKPESLFDYNVDDFEVIGYDPYPAIRLPVAV